MNNKTKEFIKYLNEQFPTTIGHLSIEEKLKEIESESVSHYLRENWAFTIDKTEQKRILDWMNNKNKKQVGAIGGRYSYLFCPTTLGVIIKVKDDCAGDEIDVTDYEGW